MENSHMISINIHGIFPSIDRKKHRTTGEYWNWIHGNILNTSLKE
jgi:hypothetical protein